LNSRWTAGLYDPVAGGAVAGNIHAGVHTTGRICGQGQSGGYERAAARGVRGFGAPQSLFCDGAAHGSDRCDRGHFSAEVRRRNFLKTRKTTNPRRKRYGEAIDLGSFSTAGWHWRSMARRKIVSERRMIRQSQKGNWHRNVSSWRGFTAIGRAQSEFRGAVEGRADGSVRVLVSSTEFGKDEDGSLPDCGGGTGLRLRM